MRCVGRGTAPDAADRFAERGGSGGGAWSAPPDMKVPEDVPVIKVAHFQGRPLCNQFRTENRFLLWVRPGLDADLIYSLLAIQTASILMSHFTVTVVDHLLSCHSNRSMIP